jgi:hypothetical protein
VLSWQKVAAIVMVALTLLLMVGLAETWPMTALGAMFAVAVTLGIVLWADARGRRPRLA